MEYRLFIINGIVVVSAIGALFWALKTILNNGLNDMKTTLKAELGVINIQCKLVSGNLHGELVAETKQRVIATNKIEKDFKTHGHKGLNNGDDKVTL